MKKILKYTLWMLVGLIVTITLFVCISVAPIDYTPSSDMAYYHQMDSVLEASHVEYLGQGTQWHCGYAKRNITPSPMHMAGSGLSREFKDVHDSIFVRVLVISNGIGKVAIVSADMLLMPPSVIQSIGERRGNSGWRLDELYVGATHTHTSIGGWGDNIAGTFYAGDFDQKIVDKVADSIIECVKEASSNLKPSTLEYGAISVTGLLTNRLADEEGGIDSLVRIVRVVRSDGTKAILSSFTGHATCIGSGGNTLSRDYPGVLVDRLESGEYDFALFMAGAVGSHACKGGGSGLNKANFVGDSLAQAIVSNKHLDTIHAPLMARVAVPIFLPPSQMRLTSGWRMRPWLFEYLFEPTPVKVNVLRLGDLIMIGTPCDYSGELTPPIDSLASLLGKQAMVTSFNGGYIGYITLDKHYPINHYETHIMNWYGPNKGEYFVGILERLLIKSSERQ